MNMTCHAITQDQNARPERRRAPTLKTIKIRAACGTVLRELPNDLDRVRRCKKL